MKTLSPSAWKDYSLIDSGNFEKLERFGEVVVRRPEPQAVWDRSLSEAEWMQQADASFISESSSQGKWDKRHPKVPEQWFVSYRNKGLKLRFRLGLTSFKHVGLFPEQAANWDFIYQACNRIPNARVLNLFAYTGGATLAARAAGADVIHCDSIRQVIHWAKENMEASKLTDVRWLLEDAFKFVKREASRGNKYSGIILDPPAWGHGPKGEKWKLEDQINEMMGYVASILEPSQSFLVLNSYSLGFSPLILSNLIQSHFGKKTMKQLELGELYLPEEAGNRRLPAGVFARFFR